MKAVYDDGLVKIIQGDVFEVLRSLKALSVQTTITSPPYWRQRVYMVDDETSLEGQIGQEYDWRDYVDIMAEWADEIRRVTKFSGTLWLNMGNRYGMSAASGGQAKWESARDIYSKGTGSAYGIKDKVNRQKNLMGLPYRLVFRLTDEQNWLWRNEIPWHKPNAMPTSKQDALTPTWEPFFLLSKTGVTRFRLDRIRVPQRKASWLRQLAADKLEAHTGHRRTPDSKHYDGVSAEAITTSSTERASRYEADIHPRGKNPGDVELLNPREPELAIPSSGQQIPMFPSISKPPPIEVKVIDTDGVSEGINPITRRLYSPDWKGARNPAGVNPGDVISDPEYEDWYKNQREKKGFHSHQDDNVRGQRREAGGAPALTHPGGASPPDVIESSPEDFLEFYSDPEDFWTIPTTKGARKRRQRENPHYAAFPEAVCVAPILATTDPLDLVLDPFAGTGSVTVKPRPGV